MSDPHDIVTQELSGNVLTVSLNRPYNNNVDYHRGGSQTRPHQT